MPFLQEQRSQPADIWGCGTAALLVPVVGLPQIVAKHPHNQFLSPPSQWDIEENRRNESKKTHRSK